MTGQPEFTWEEDEEFLQHQVVMTLGNDSDFYHKVNHHVPAGNFKEYRKVVCAWVERMEVQLGITSTRSLRGSARFIPSLRNRVSEQLWHVARENLEISPDTKCQTYGDVIKAIKQAYYEAHAPQESNVLSDVQTTVESVNATLITLESNMTINTTAAFSTVNYVFGQDISSMTEDQLISAIKKAEGQIRELGTVNTPSKKLDAKKVEIEKGIAEMVKALDAM